MTFPVRQRRSFVRPAGRVLLAVSLLVIAFLMLAPLIWLASNSLTRPDEALGLPPRWLPIPFSTENYAEVFSLIPILRMMGNSIVVSVISVVGSLFVAALAAYGFARIPFRGSGPLFMVLLSAMMIPPQLTIIPVFILMKSLGLVDHLAALWLPALINVFAIFFLRQYFQSIPRDLDDAARIDGAGHLRILFRIILPLSGPALSALAILAFEASWNNYFQALVLLNTPERLTLPVGLVALSSGIGGASPAVVFAGICIVVAPMLLLFLLFQRAFIESVAAAGIRG